MEIDGFWGKYRAFSEFKDDVNIIIGKNGTGKTTFMNILNAVLAVDIVGLTENEFTSATIKLGFEGSIRTVKVTKSDDTPFQLAKYQIAQRRYLLPLVGTDEIRSASLYRRRAAEAAITIKQELAGLVSLASLSVYRFRTTPDIEASDRGLMRRVQGPVDMRLHELMQGLTKYQLELSQQAREISADLQREVLMSLLHKPDLEPNQAGFALNFDANQERQNLISAYKQLGISGSSINKRINDHVSAIDNTVKEIKKYIRENPSPDKALDHFDFAPLEASKRAHRIFDMSLEAEAKTKDLFSQINLFLGIISDFIDGKKFIFEGGNLTISEPRQLNVSKLSSGEKQLLILFTEALLQREEPFIFLADEPELSLHIAWQRKIIPAVKSLNQNAQVIVATHSPEVASKYRDAILDMEDILHVNA
ncbi:putative bacteriocin export ABC transporter [compost metagenome]